MTHHEAMLTHRKPRHQTTVVVVETGQVVIFDQAPFRRTASCGKPDPIERDVEWRPP